MVICGGIIELLAHLLTLGMTNASQWLARDFNMNDWNSIADGTGWRVLEMIHIATLGMILWVDTFEAMALLGIVIVIFYSVVTEEQFMVERSNNIMSTGEAAGATDISSDVLNTEEYSGSEHGSSQPCPTPPPPSNAFRIINIQHQSTSQANIYKMVCQFRTIHWCIGTTRFPRGCTAFCQ